MSAWSNECKILGCMCYGCLYRDNCADIPHQCIGANCNNCVTSFSKDLPLNEICGVLFYGDLDELHGMVKECPYKKEVKHENS